MRKLLILAILALSTSFIAILPSEAFCNINRRGGFNNRWYPSSNWGWGGPPARRCRHGIWIRNCNPCRNSIFNTRFTSWSFFNRPCRVNRGGFFYSF